MSRGVTRTFCCPSFISSTGDGTTIAGAVSQIGEAMRRMKNVPSGVRLDCSAVTSVTWSRQSRIEAGHCASANVRVAGSNFSRCGAAPGVNA